MNAPKLLTKDEENIENVDLIEYLENTPACEILNNLMPEYPEKYLSTINDIYANIDLPKGVLNCMIIKVLKASIIIQPPFYFHTYRCGNEKQRGIPHRRIPS